MILWVRQEIPLRSYSWTVSFEEQRCFTHVSSSWSQQPSKIPQFFPRSLSSSISLDQLMYMVIVLFQHSKEQKPMIDLLRPEPRFQCCSSHSEFTQHHFCCILFVNASCKASPYSRERNRLVHLRRSSIYQVILSRTGDGRIRRQRV